MTVRYVHGTKGDRPGKLIVDLLFGVFPFLLDFAVGIAEGFLVLEDLCGDLCADLLRVRTDDMGFVCWFE